MTPEPWRLVVTARAERALGRLPAKAAVAVVEAFSAIADDPRRVGKPLRLELEGLWTARRGPYRILYRFDEQSRTVTIVTVGHRADVYRRR